MEPLKNTYTNKEIFRQIAKDMKKVCREISEEKFYQALIDDLESLELKARIERVADVCRQFLPSEYNEALNDLYRFVEGKDNKLVYLFLPTFVAKYGQAHYDKSIKAIRDFTQYSSSEEGVRTFLAMDIVKTLRHMQEWTKSENVHIRRLASEGCRSRLPWAKKISILIEKPELTWPILETLKDDPEKYVQKSVANHINDISKDHADWVVQRIKTWDLKNPITFWIVKHGMRTLIKQGNKGALSLFGTHQKPQVRLENIVWDKKVKLGNVATYSCSLVSLSKKSQSLVIDYKIFFNKKNGQQNSKTFKAKQYELKSGERLPLKLRYIFKNLTTRKHYPGKHAWQLMINGDDFLQSYFELKKA